MPPASRRNEWTTLPCAIVAFAARSQIAGTNFPLQSYRSERQMRWCSSVISLKEWLHFARSFFRCFRIRSVFWLACPSYRR